MTSCRLQRIRFLLVAVTVSQVWITTCTGNDVVTCNTTEIQEASIGNELTLHCSVLCLASTYWWFNSTDQLPGETREDLTVSEKVENAAAVGGQRYACQCGETGPTECYTVWVTPYVRIDMSKEVVKLGSSVTITCSAESYPLADNVAFFQLHHPLNYSIPHDQLNLVNTSVEYHVANASQSDGGEYDCVVDVYATPDGIPLQSERRVTYLTVYDPPVIIETRSSAVMLSDSSGGEPAILECVVENRETNLKVWVNWTAGGEFDPIVGDDYTIGRSDGGVHFLVVHRATKENVHPYTCQLFSHYSPNTPEDQQTINVTVVDLQKCNNTSALYRPEDCDCSTAIIAVSVTLVVVIIVIGTVLVVVSCWKCKSKGSQIGPQAGEGTDPVHLTPAYENPIYQREENSFNDGSENETNTSPRSEPREEGSEQGRNTDIINQNGASIHRSLSMQSQGLDTIVEEMGTREDESVRPNGASPQNSKDSETKDLDKETHPHHSVSPRKNDRRRFSSTSGSDPEEESLIDD